MFLVSTSVKESRQPGGGSGLFFHSDKLDNEDVLVCTLEGVLKDFGTFKYQKKRR